MGFIQGLTEFLPVSSSGHLVILKHWLNIEGDNLALNIILHLGTLLAVVIFLRRQIKDFVKNVILWRSVIITTAITGIIGVLGKNFFEKIFEAPKIAALGLVITATALFSISRRMDGKRTMADLTILDAILVGLFQGAAIVPGISRSGVTISVQLWRGIERQAALRYSFLISIPAILGASIMELPERGAFLNINPIELGAGFLTALLVGLVSLRLLVWVMQKAKFPLFGYYCLFAALVGLLGLVFG